jgi:hypothetical protein
LSTSGLAFGHELSGAQVTGASDKTLRQWDMATGQCIMTMDILWALSHPPPSAGVFAAEPTPAYSNGSYDVLGLRARERERRRRRAHVGQCVAPSSPSLSAR